MKYTEKPVFKQLNNSFLLSGLMKVADHKQNAPETRTPDDKLSNNLGMISGLYIYTNTPPHGYGSQGPKVAETVKRAYGYNLKKQNTKFESGGIKIERLHWEKEVDGPFPYDDIHGNLEPKQVKKMAMEFLKANHATIDSCVDKCIEEMMHSNSDQLTKGRQTLDAFTHSSVAASVAYKEMYDFFKDNLEFGSVSCLGWIRMFFQTLSKDSVKMKVIEKKRDIETKYDPKIRMRIMKEVKRDRVVKRVIKGEEVRKRMMNMARSFASYIKHKERGKKDRRAIASANVILRMFLKIVEDFHLDLGKKIQGSTISVGGEEKKAKIINNLNEVCLDNAPVTVEIQGTEDATKWNECLSPAGFGIMHKTFFDEDVREELGLPEVTEHGVVFREVALSCHYLMAIKRIQMGPGPIAESENLYNRLDWLESDMGRFNEKTQDWLKFIRTLLDDENYLLASPGMLMGMLNAASTTYGLIVANYGLIKKHQQVKTLRSSDDSTTLYSGTSVPHLIKCVEANRRALALAGINLSLEKTFFFERHYSEYTSWYQDQNFVSQFGVETSAIRPQGKNPPDDFYAIAKGTATGLATLTMNHIGAIARLSLGIDATRRLWKIDKNKNKRPGVDSKVLVLSDGGDNVWDSANCHLEEISLKEHFAKTNEEKEYLLKLCDPDNPFAPEPMEEVTYSWETGRLTTTEVETPRTAFHFLKRSNRTVHNSQKETLAANEKMNSEVNKIIKSLVPTTMVKYPTESTLMYRQLLATLALEKSSVELSESEMKEYNECVLRLRGIAPEEEDIEMTDVEHFWEET